MRRFLGKVKVIIVCGVLFLSISLVTRDGIKLKTHRLFDKSLYHYMFTQPIEICYFIMKSGQMYGITQNLEDRVIINLDKVEQDFKKKGLDFSDIAIFVHNHLNIRRISDGDLEAFRSLQKRGFKGSFVIYLQGANTALVYEEK